MRAMRLEGGFNYKSWESKGFRIVKECIQKFAESLVHDIVQGEAKINRQNAVRWLERSPTFVKMVEYVFLHLYHYRPTTAKNTQDETMPVRRRSIFANSTELLPFCEGIVCVFGGINTFSHYSGDWSNRIIILLGLQYVPDYPAFTDVTQMMFINSNLPQEYRSKWRFLFSSQIHGESFSTLMGRIVDQGPSVIIIEDTNGAVFGGFASASWTYSPKFVGGLDI